MSLSLQHLLSVMGLGAMRPAPTPKIREVPPEIVRAKALLLAIDRGGIPISPIRLRTAAEDIGLEVSHRALPEDTIARIRAAVGRSEAFA